MTFFRWWALMVKQGLKLILSVYPSGFERRCFSLKWTCNTNNWGIFWRDDWLFSMYIRGTPGKKNISWLFKPFSIVCILILDILKWTFYGQNVTIFKLPDQQISNTMYMYQDCVHYYAINRNLFGLWRSRWPTLIYEDQLDCPT